MGPGEQGRLAAAWSSWGWPVLVPIYSAGSFLQKAEGTAGRPGWEGMWEGKGEPLGRGKEPT